MKGPQLATISGRNGAIRLPAGASIIAHTLHIATITSSPWVSEVEPCEAVAPGAAERLLKRLTRVVAMPDGGGTRRVENHPLAPLGADGYGVTVTLVNALALA